MSQNLFHSKHDHQNNKLMAYLFGSIDAKTCSKPVYLQLYDVEVTFFFECTIFDLDEWRD